MTDIKSRRPLGN